MQRLVCFLVLLCAPAFASDTAYKEWLAFKEAFDSLVQATRRDPTIELTQDGKQALLSGPGVPAFDLLQAKDRQKNWSSIDAMLLLLRDRTGPAVTFTTPAMDRTGAAGLPANGSLAAPG